jgi:hypothetical protein
MPYQFALERPDYSDLASGRVLLSAAGHPAFPIRLASEILQRCLAWRAAAGLHTPCVLYDPCCGAGYTLTVLGYLHGASLSALLGSDIDATALGLAQRNLSLLSHAGLDARIDALSALLGRFGKDSHRVALASAHRLRTRLDTLLADHPHPTLVFQADALDGPALRAGLHGMRVDIVLVDVPYGLHSQWRLEAPASPSPSPVWQLLEALSGVVGSQSLVAIVSDKAQRASHAGYKRVQQFQAGKRRVAIFTPAGA